MMRRALILPALVAAGLAACAPAAYEAEPVSAWQWQQRQERIERQEADRVRRCQTMDPASERHARECRRSGDSA